MSANKIGMARLILLTLVSIILVSGCLEGEKTDLNYPIIQSFNYNFRLQNNLNRTIPKTDINLYLPLTKTSSQRLLDHSVIGLDSSSARVLDDGLDNKLLSLSLQELPAGYSTTLKIATTIGFSKEPVELKDVDINRYLLKANSGKALIERLNIEFLAEDSLTKKVQKLSRALSSSDVVFDGDNAESYDVEYSGINDGMTDKFASACLQQVDRFIAGARVMDIPTRALVGFVKKEEQGALVLTCWPEVYNQSHWQMVDLVDHKLINKSSGSIIAMRVLISLEDHRQSQLSDLLSEGYGLNVSYAVN